MTEHRQHPRREIPNAPKAERRGFAHKHHGVVVEDPYAWLEDPNYPTVEDADILSYLSQENDYFQAFLAPHCALVSELFEELKQRKPETDAGVPYLKNGYRYQWRFDQGADYRCWYRQAEHAQPDDPWEVLLDEQALAETLPYFRLGSLAVSPDASKLAFSYDANGSERFELHIIDIQSRATLSSPIPNTGGQVIWNQQSNALLYLTVNDQWRPDRVWHHQLSGDSEDRLVYHENDEGFFVSLSLSQSEAVVFVVSGDHVSSEARWLPRDRFEAEPALMVPRQPGHEYYPDHRGESPDSGELIIRSNKGRPNFDIWTCSVDASNLTDWQRLVSGDDHTYILDHLVLRDALIIAERQQGLDQIRVVQGEQSYRIPWPEAAYSVEFDLNVHYDTQRVRLIYSSMVTPPTNFEYDLVSREHTALKVLKVGGGYDAKNFQTQRLLLRARDGTQIPLSLVRHRSTSLDAQAPLYLYGYGAYGHAVAPSFSSNVISLLERGFIFAIAHIRGGDDLGHHWYEQGKLDQRQNTFNDFVDCARGLTDQGIAQPGNIAIGGGSAGGELMGAAVNQAPELFASVAAHVPFVDVLNTMLNPTLPLTPMEWPEWGNPIEDAEAYHCIQNYSPYDQVSPRAYPPMFVTAGLQDPRVTYWEPAKWVAKLRQLKTDDHILLLKTNMQAGHGGQSGRYKALMEVAEEYAFFLLMSKDT